MPQAQRDGGAGSGVRAAILLMLTRLGLRAGEVAGLWLDDVDWRHGELLVRGKGGRQDVLPLPVDVGEALVAYLRRHPCHVDSQLSGPGGVDTGPRR